MNINNLIVTQVGLRNITQLDDMIDFVQRGGVFNHDSIFSGRRDPKLIAINAFEDGQTYIHDGHHRVAAIFLSGTRDFLFPEEFFVTNFHYHRYIKANFSNNWYTPFDPRTHVRLQEFFDFKNHVVALAAKSYEQAHDYIVEHQHDYLAERSNLRHIQQIISK